MEIRNLMTFVRIAELQNFSKTAEQLGYSQSAVTMQIKQLEKELQVQLFERIGKRVQLTQAGERLLPYALEILNAQAMARTIAREPGQIAGKLRIGTCESYVISVLPEIIMELGAICPHVEVSTPTALVPDLVQMLKQIPISRLLREPLYLTEQGISYRYAMEQMLAARGYELHPVWEVGNTDVITRCLLKNKGISFLPEYVVHRELEEGRLVVLDTECEEIIMWSQLVYHRRKCVTPQMRQFLELMKTHGY